MADGLTKPRIRRTPAIGNAERRFDTRLGGVWLTRLVRHVEIEVEDALVVAAQNGKHAMRRHVLDALTELEIVGELGALIVLALAHARSELAIAPQPFAQVADETGRLGDALDEDVARTVQRDLDVRDAFVSIDEARSFFLGVKRGIIEQRIGQRFELGFTRDLRLSAPLLLEGRVKVFQLDFSRRFLDKAGELRRELALLLDRLQHSGATILQLAQVAKPLL